MLSPAQHIRTALFERIERNPAYSLRAFARDLGVSHTYLSLVLNEKKNISPRQATWMAQAMKLDGAQTTSFVQSVMDRGERRPRSTATALFRSLEIDRMTVLNSWYHFAILDLTLLSSFRPELPWIAKRLGIKVSQVRTAAARLERLGLLKRERNRWTKTDALLSIPTTRSEAPMRRLHREFILKSLEALASANQTDFEARLISGSMIPANPARLPEVKKRIHRFRRQMIRYLSEGDCTELYQLNVQLFPLTKTRRTKAAKEVA